MESLLLPLLPFHFLYDEEDPAFAVTDDDPASIPVKAEEEDEDEDEDDNADAGWSLEVITC